MTIDVEVNDCARSNFRRGREFSPAEREDELMTVPIIEKIRSADSLPSLPAVAVQVLEAVRADDVSIEQLTSIIQQDPALTGKILRVVNSSLFGIPRKISSSHQAVVALGLRTVRVMALSFSLVETFGWLKGHAFDYQGYWRRSLTTAVASRLLAEKVRPSVADEAFTGGLLCDIGILAGVHCAADFYKPVLQKYAEEKGTIQAVEQEILGLTHEFISYELLNYWEVPEILCMVVATHHARIEELVPPDPNEGILMKLVRSGAALADLFFTDAQEDQIEAVQQEIAKGLRIDIGAFREVLEALDSQVSEMAGLLVLEIGSTQHYHEIQKEAIRQLERLTMTAGRARTHSAQHEEKAHRKITRLDEQNRELTQKAATDSLTGIGNRAALDQRLSRNCADFVSQKRPLGLLLIDLDKFKMLNDEFGHQMGDEALRRVGECLQSLSGQTTFAARYGGEEFAMVVADATAQELRDLAERIRRSIQQIHISKGQKSISVTASIGGAHMTHDDPALKPETLLERADQCLYDAKHTGRNRVVLRDSQEANRLPDWKA